MLLTNWLPFRIHVCDRPENYEKLIAEHSRMSVITLLLANLISGGE